MSHNPRYVKSQVPSCELTTPLSRFVQRHENVSGNDTVCQSISRLFATLRGCSGRINDSSEVVCSACSAKGRNAHPPGAVPEAPRRSCPRGIGFVRQGVSGETADALGVGPVGALVCSELLPRLAVERCDGAARLVAVGAVGDDARLLPHPKTPDHPPQSRNRVTLDVVSSVAAQF